jgi:Mg-chelatase subunit ChlD
MRDFWANLELTDPALLAGLALLPLLLAAFARGLVDLPRWQRLVSLACRSALLALVVLAAAGLTALEPSRRPFVVFAVDESLSVGSEGRAAADAFLERALAARGDRPAAFLPFAAVPGAVRPAREPAGEALDARGTDLAAALEVAAAAIPPGHLPHVVLLTDGNQTRGDLLETALRMGVPVSAVPLPARGDPEVQVSAVHVPAQVREGEPFRVEVVLDANHDDEGVIEVYRGPHKLPLPQERYRVRKGENRFPFDQKLVGERQATYTVKIRDFHDTLRDNNAGRGLVYVSGKPRVLLVDVEPPLAQPLRDALEEEGIEVEVRPARGVPETLADLQNYELLVLSNVPATDLSQRQMEAVRTYVQKLGGGFVMLGGDQSFGLGGYYKTAVEEILPVRSDFEKEKDKPSLALVLVIDRSGSMAGQKLELVKEASKSAVELLGPSDKVGVIAFDSETQWVSDQVQSAADRAGVCDRISRIDVGGGTVMYPALQAAHEALRASVAKLKHVIVLTDGVAESADFEGLAAAMSRDRITVSAVAVGSDADRRLLAEVARAGNGRFYPVDDPTSVPQVFVKETMAAGKSALDESAFTPQLVTPTPVLAGLDWSAAPVLLGHVRTRPKATGEVILATERADPLLAWWRYGLGMSVAFTSDAKSRWAAEWLTWPGYPKFWAQVVRHALRKSDVEGAELKVEHRDGRATVTLDTTEKRAGRFLNGAAGELTVITDRELNARPIPMAQTAPGRYVAEFDTPEQGTYHLDVVQRVGDQVVCHQSRGLVVGYPDELRLRPTDEALLRAVAEVSGGRYDPEPETVFEAPARDARRPVPLRPYLLLAAAVLLVLDAGVRRLDFSRLAGRFRRRRVLASAPRPV